MGNRTSLTSTGSENYTTEYVYDDNNRLITETKSAGADGNVTSYTYDANGNTLTKSVVDGENGISGTTYEYNLIGQQTKSTTNGKSVCYSYNAQGIRTAKVTSNRYTSYYLDAANVAAEDVNGNITSYIRGINLIASISEGGTYYYTFNAHGDVVGLMNESNQLAKSYDYDAFGVEKNPSSEDSNPFRYCGEYYDVETGTYYLRARYYDPRIGRFTQQDKVNYVKNKLPNGNEVIDPLSLNLYVYCVNSPLMLCDLSGLSPELTQIVQGALMIGIGVLSVAAVVATGGTAAPVIAAGYATFASAGVVVAVQGASEITEAVTGNNPVKNFTGECIYNGLTNVSLGVIAFEISALSFTGNITSNNTLSPLENANFAQKTYSNTFSKEGIRIYSEAAGKPIKTVQDLSKSIINGEIKIQDIQINYINRDGNTLILNTRSAQALVQAGIPRDQWNAVNMTGNELYEKMLTEQLARNNLTSTGISNVIPK